MLFVAIYENIAVNLRSKTDQKAVNDRSKSEKSDSYAFLRVLL